MVEYGVFMQPLPTAAPTRLSGMWLESERIVTCAETETVEVDAYDAAKDDEGEVGLGEESM